MNQRFGETYHIHPQVRKSAEQETIVFEVALSRLIFYPDDGNTFL
jgi:hypothetical protein